jgi:putative ABC transport system ATP-binding protein
MIEIDNIYLKINERILFDGFSFSAASGEIVCLRAPSGRGKTTLFRMMMGFTRPDSGAISIGGQWLGRTTVHDIRRRICYIGQDVSLPGIKVGEMFAEAAAFAVNRDKDFSSQRIESYLAQFGLSKDIRDKSLDAVSGGERQRLAFVLCLLMDRDIWLLDEITTGLDEERKREVIACIVGSGKTVIVISHDDAWNGYDAVRRVSW